MKLLNWLSPLVAEGCRQVKGRRSWRAARVRYAALVESLEHRVLLSAAFPEFVDPNPSAGNKFGETVLALSTGNVVITSPFDDAGGTDAGAVYLFNGATGALISTLTGSSSNDNVGGGGVIAVGNGNYVIRSSFWDLDEFTRDVGAMTFGNGTTGVSGVVSAANSLVGSSANDILGSSFVSVLSNGNYVVLSPNWDLDATHTDVGAATFGSGTTGISGAVSAANSLVGSTTGDKVGGSVTRLSNGNYVVRSVVWDLDATHINVGAITFGNGTTGISGTVSAANSLVGSTTGDFLSGNVTALSNGNYVVSSPNWDLDATHTDVGAATFGDGTTVISGVISAANSLVGSTTGDQVGSSGVTALSNGNYVVRSANWDLDATHTDVGAVTFGDGTTGISGVLSAANSLVGSTTGDQVGSSGVTALSNGNYVVSSPNWDLDATHTDVGAATFGDGTTGISGAVSSANSLVGSTTGDQVGSSGVTALSNGNYVVRSANWDLDATHTDVGAATFGDGTTGISGAVSAVNSLVGSTTGDQVGSSGVTALSNGNYVVSSPNWDLDATHTDVGTATFGDGTTGISGAVSAANSLVGSTTGDQVSNSGITALNNGNYVVRSSLWDLDATHTNVGAATFGSGTTGISGTVSGANSLVGATTDDRVSSTGVTPLSNGNYVVLSGMWDLDGTHTDVGAATFGSGTTGISGAVSAANSLVGSTTNDQVGGSVKALSNGNYVVVSANWDLDATNTDAGAVTFGSGTTGVVGVINSKNSATGLTASTGLQAVVSDDTNSTFFGRFQDETGGFGGRVRVGSQVNGFAPPTTTLSLDGSNNLVIDDTDGGDTNDALTIQSDTANGRFVISDPINQLATSISGASGNGTNTLMIPFASVSGSQILVSGQAGNDSLTIDLSLGDFSKAITFNGGTQTTSDSITITGGARTFATVTHTATSASSGSIAVTGNGAISYLGLEPVTDNLSATARVFTFNGGAETITLTDATGANMTIDSTLSESITFANPTGSLTINAGSGNDTVTINAVDASYDASLTIDGGTETDTVNLNGDVTFATGKSLSVSAETVNTAVDADLVTSGAGTISITADDVAIDTTSTLQSASTVTFVTQTAARLINLGTQTAGSLSLTDGELDRVTSGTTQIGDTNSGALTVSAAITHANDLSLTTGAGVTVSHAVTMAADKDLSINSSSTTAAITLAFVSADLTTTGSGAVSITAARNIQLTTGSSISTVDGGITVSANSTGLTTGDFDGLDVVNALIQTTGTGNITLSGKGANNGNVNSGQIGTVLRGGTSVSSTSSASGAGTITITGTGGSGTVGNYGIYLIDDKTDVTSVAGAIAITGTGGNGTGIGSFGVYLHDIETIQSTGTGANAGTITITGVAGSGTGSLFGLRIGGSTTDVTSIDGAITITGTGGSGSSNGNSGVVVESDATLQVTTSALTVTGTALTGDSVGVLLSNGDGGRLVSIGTGSITLTADGNGNSEDLVAGADSIIGDATHVGAASAATGNITISANKISFFGSAMSVETDGALVIAPLTAETTIGLGTSATGTLNLDAAELGFLQDGFSSITIGNAVAGTGAVDVNALTFVDNLTIVGGPISVTGLNAGTNSVALTARTGAITDGGDSATDVTGGAVTLQTLAGSGGTIGATGDHLSVSATSLATNSSASNANQFLSGASTAVVGTSDLNAGTSTITLGSGSFVTATGGGDIVSPVTVANGATLSGTGTTGAITVQSGGHVAPGTSPGVLNSGNVSFSSGSNFDVEIGGTTPGNTSSDHDQLVVTGTVALGSATLNLSAFNAFVPMAGNTFAILLNDGSDAITGTFNGLAEGAFISNFLGTNLTATISYVGNGDAGATGNDVVITVGTAPTLSATIVGNDLVIEDVDGTGKENALSLSRSDSNLIISDANEKFFTSISGAVLSNSDKTVTIPASVLGSGGKVIVKGQGGNDSLSVDLSPELGTDVEFQGGSGTSDSLTLATDSVTSVTHTRTSANEGSITVDDGSVMRVISYTGIEPINDNLTAGQRTFEFSGGAETITVSDGTAADGKMLLDSTLGEPISFKTSLEDLTIDGGSGDDTITLLSIDAGLGASLHLKGGGGFDIINFNGDVTIAPGEDLFGEAETINIAAGVDLTSQNSGGEGSLSFTADDVSIDLTSTLVSPQVVKFTTHTSGRALNLGTEASGSLSLTDGELDRITSNITEITNQFGNITISAPITHENALTVVATADHDIDVGMFSLASPISVLIATSGTGRITTADNSGTDIAAPFVLMGSDSGAIGSTTNFVRIAADKLSAISMANGAINVAAADVVEIASPTDSSGLLDAGTGTITLGGGKFLTSSDDTIASAITVANGATLAGTGPTQAVNVQSGGHLAPGSSPAIFNSGDVSFSSGANFDVEIGGTTPGDTSSNHDQLVVTGTVSLGNATLNTSAFNSFVPVTGNSFALLLNDGTDAITGTFNGLPEGGVISNFFGTGLNATISYVGNADGGASGNDVVLTVGTAPTLTASIVESRLTITDADGSKNNSLTLSVSGSNIVITDANEAFMSAPAGGSLSNSNKTLTIPASAVTRTLTINSTGGADTIDVSALGSTLLSELRINTGTGNDTLNLNGDVTFAPGKDGFFDAETINVAAGTDLVTQTVGEFGSLQFVADDMSIASTSTLVSGASVEFTSLTAGRTTNLGTQAVGTLSLTQAQLDRVTASKIYVSASAAGVTLSAPIAHASALVVQAGADHSVDLGTFSLTSAIGVEVTSSGTGGITTADNTGTDISAPYVLLATGSGGAGSSINFVRIAADRFSVSTNNGPVFVTEADVVAIDYTNSTSGLLDAGTAAVTLGGGTFVTSSDDLILSSITVANGATLAGTGPTQAVTVQSGGHIAPGSSPAIFNSGDVSFSSGSNLDVEINGTTVGTEYDQLSVTGTVNLGGATLNVALGFTPMNGASFTIIANDGSDAVTGTFNGLPEGGSFTVSSTRFLVSYVGGTGNDVVLTVQNDVTAPTANIVDVTPDPRTTNAGVVSIDFDEAVTGVDISDFSLTRDGKSVDISGLSVSGSSKNYTLDLTTVTVANGKYELTLNATGSGIVDAASNPLAADATDDWTRTSPTVSLSVNNASIAESGSATVTATLSQATDVDVTIDLGLTGTANGTLTGNTDYTTSGSQIVISKGKTTGSITVTPNDDTLDEPNETVIVSLGKLSNVTAGATTSVTVTITDNDAGPINAVVSGGKLVITSTQNIAADVRVTFNSGTSQFAVTSFSEGVAATVFSFAAASVTNGLQATLGAQSDRFDVSGFSLRTTISGGDGNDTILGSQGIDSVLGGAGNDILQLNNGDDIALGGDGNDVLRGGAGRDSLVGEAGNDSLFGQGAVDSLIGGSGIDLLDGGDSGTAIEDDFAGDLTMTNTGYQTLRGDRVVAQAIGYATLTGSAGNDSYNGLAFNSGIVTVFGGDGDDTLRGGSTKDVFYGDGGNDIVNGGGNQDVLFGGDGNDTVNGVGASDVISGGPGNDRLIGGDGDNRIREDVTGTFTLVTTSGVVTMTGLGTDVIEGSFTTAFIAGGSSADTIDLSAFAGMATLFGGDGNDTITGTTGADRLYGGNNNDVLNGHDGDDLLVGEAGEDALNGNAGDDLLRGGAGNDTIDGGDGSDRQTEQSNDNFSIVGLQISSISMGTETPSNIERINLQGGSSANLIDARQSSLPVLLVGGNGNDTLLGSAFDDTLQGDAGDDVLSGGAGNDELRGGNGTDTQYETLDADASITGSSLTAEPLGTDVIDSGDPIEAVILIGGAGNNSFNASAATIPVTLFGGEGDDTLIGGSQPDVLIGGNRASSTAGTDSLTGNGGVDTLDNDLADTRVAAGSDTVLADVFATLPSWIDAL